MHLPEEGESLIQPEWDLDIFNRKRRSVASAKCLKKRPHNFCLNCMKKKLTHYEALARTVHNLLSSLEALYFRLVLVHYNRGGEWIAVGGGVHERINISSQLLNNKNVIRYRLKEFKKHVQPFLNNIDNNKSACLKLEQLLDHACSLRNQLKQYIDVD